MKRYPLLPDFSRYSRLYPPLWRPLLPLMQGVTAHLPRPALTLPGVSVSEYTLPARDGTSLSLLCYSPAAAGDASPCLLLLHGGGFVLEAAPYHYRLAEQYAAGAGCRVLFPRYRLAPRHPFPTPADDCMDVYLYATAHAAEWGIDPARIAVGGDSAGAALAAGLCLRARDSGLPLPLFQMLLYPVTDRRMASDSMRRFPDTPMWNARLNRRMWQWYLPDAARADLSYASPAEAEDFSGLPDAYLETAEFDCLHDEGMGYAAALRDADCRVELTETCGTMHGFDIALESHLVKGCVNWRIDALRRAFSTKA